MSCVYERSTQRKTLNASRADRRRAARPDFINELADVAELADRAVQEFRDLRDERDWYHDRVTTLESALRKTRHEFQEYKRIHPEKAVGQ